MILALPSLSEMTLAKECLVLSGLAGDSYHQAILQYLCPLFLIEGASGAASLAFLGCADLCDYALFGHVLQGKLCLLPA